ncbi:MAG: hypothetical protein K6F50_02290 [Kiritimatiellae bacterium]|nr:hypothetical protein [Kiritimatiellia bacterium]
MKSKVDRGIVSSAIAAAASVGFAVLLLAVARSFRSSIAEMVESETRVTIVNSDGSVFYDTEDATGNHASREEVRNAFSGGSGSALRHSETLGRDLMYCARRVGDKVVRLAVPYTGVIRSERLAWVGLSSALALGLCMVVLVFFATRNLTRRLDEQSKRLEIASASEKYRREFTSNVTHELKSPLTSIQGAVDILGDGSSLSPEERSDLFGIITRETGRLASLVGDVLSLAKIEQEECCEKRDFTDVSMAELVEVAASGEELNANASHAKITVARNDGVHVMGNVGQLEEVLRNLLENAMRYSGSDRIEIRSVASQGTVTVSVKDFGIGIPAEHLPHIFERFYRVNKSRSRSLGGTGLGLAIVKHIVQLHGGTVSAVSRPGVETEFSFTLPLAGGISKTQSA